MAVVLRQDRGPDPPDPPEDKYYAVKRVANESLRNRSKAQEKLKIFIPKK